MLEVTFNPQGYEVNKTNLSTKGFVVLDDIFWKNVFCWEVIWGSMEHFHFDIILKYIHNIKLQTGCWMAQFARPNSIRPAYEQMEIHPEMSQTEHLKFML